MTEPNCEGLTFLEWCRAAGCAETPMLPEDMLDVVTAWQRGEDPTDYRAENQRAHTMALDDARQWAAKYGIAQDFDLDDAARMLVAFSEAGR